MTGLRFCQEKRHKDIKRKGVKERREKKKQEKLLTFFDSHPEKAFYQQQQGSVRKDGLYKLSGLDSDFGSFISWQPDPAAVECCKHLTSLNLL